VSDLIASIHDLDRKIIKAKMVMWASLVVVVLALLAIAATLLIQSSSRGERIAAYRADSAAMLKLIADQRDDLNSYAAAADLLAAQVERRGGDPVVDPADLPGPAGAPGLSGLDGEDGRDGRDGRTGPRGPRGYPGAGTDGASGIDGRDSITPGPDGAPGPQGDQGPPGPAGADGPAGQDGARGPAGLACPDGFEARTQNVTTENGSTEQYGCYRAATPAP